MSVFAKIKLGLEEAIAYEEGIINVRTKSFEKKNEIEIEPQHIKPQVREVLVHHVSR